MFLEKLKILFLCKQPVFREFPFLHPHYSIFGKKFEERNFIVTTKLCFHIRYDANLYELSFAELRFRIEDADAVNFISKQFNAVRFFITKGINIKYSSAQCELSRLIYKIRSFESISDQSF